LELGWQCLSVLPHEELDRVDQVLLKKFYREDAAAALRGVM
jgi:vacuolar-type H+-ATPase subunit B/Vma2